MQAARGRSADAQLRQFLDALAAPVGTCDAQRALALIQGTDEQRRYAAEPILNSVLRHYAQWAGETGVRLSIQFQLPPHLTPDVSGLAVVLSNALENAMHACLAIPEGKPRTIELTGRSTPGQFFLSICNTCSEHVELDPVTGRPVSHREGHGYGTKSIAAFAAAHDGTLRYACRDGLFRLQLLI